MKIVHTFITGLYSFKYDEQETNELERLFDDWNDFEFLEEFFDNHKNDLKYFGLTVESAIEETINEANLLDKLLLDIAESNFQTLDAIFKPLNNLEFRAVILSKQKARRRWLRLYAIKIEPNYYVITGGAIKLTHTMQEREHTKNELLKLEKCRQYLQSEGIFDLDSFNELDI
ncbi:hypothetical protein LV89_01071 [Arcicella aurantiaca]|uniref:Uncharacterized protein n=1 Tax=Arcicella aurantiaca TaxID=591202 RepID=A0A316EF11_9BACT|nr:hypothetical protein [Arcicella aurantiaca]PWK28288.1 hypothetical protein LV89_01071 [Arcicella aurantiaca]